MYICEKMKKPSDNNPIIPLDIGNMIHKDYQTLFTGTLLDISFRFQFIYQST